MGSRRAPDDFAFREHEGGDFEDRFGPGKLFGILSMNRGAWRSDRSGLFVQPRYLFPHPA